MNSLIKFPQAKINLGLNVLRKRADGYHDISSVLFPIGLNDILEIKPSENLSLHISGLEIPGNTSDNLIIKAWELLHTDHNIPPVEIQLQKVIPMGGGLGGGSSDATVTLLMLNELFSLQLTSEKLHFYASQLGSDCPFFVHSIPSLAEGRGTDLSPIDIDLSPYWLKLVLPSIHSSTAEAYGNLTPTEPEFSIVDIIRKPIDQWRGLLKNDFETSLFTHYPQLANIKEELYAEGAIYASMSGSGSSMFGIFKEKPFSESKYPAFVLPMTPGS